MSARRQGDYQYGSAARAYESQYAENRIRNREVYGVKPMRKTVQWTVPYVMMLVVSLMVMAISTIVYLKMQSDVTNLRDEKGQLASEYEDMRVSNDLYYENIMSNVNIKEIERIAVEELGMTMAGSGQIMTYTSDMDDYVKQYNDIPD